MDATERQVIERFLAIQREMERLEDMQAATFERYFRKLEAGIHTNGAAVARIDNRVSYLSADLSRAEGAVYSICDKYGWHDLEDAVQHYRESRDEVTQEAS